MCADFVPIADQSFIVLIIWVARWGVVSHMGKLLNNQCKCFANDFGQCLAAGCVSWPRAYVLKSYILQN
jgi:hypothetical protein